MDNNINGDGNNNHAKFWEYDTRLGRRWNMDPVVKQSLSAYESFSDNPIMYNDPLGNNEDFFENDKGNIVWDNSRSSSIDRNGETFRNIGNSLHINTVSFIDERNDIPIKGVAGKKLMTDLFITGNYNKDKFTGFTSSVTRKVGATFGFVEGKPASGVIQNIQKNADGGWSGGFDLHTQVNSMEAWGMKAMFGNIVDVNQKINYHISPSGQFNLNIGHGTFPSVRLTVINASKVEYNFLEHSFILSHGIDPDDNSGIIGLERQWESYNQNQVFSRTNSPIIHFSGYTNGTSQMTYPHLP